MFFSCAIDVFAYLVSCKQVGTIIHHLRKVSCPSFDLHFTLWRNGGPNSFREKQIRDAKDAEWHLISRKKKSYAHVASSRLRDVSVFHRLQFPADYFARNYSVDFFDNSSGDHSRSVAQSNHSHRPVLEQNPIASRVLRLRCVFLAHNRVKLLSLPIQSLWSASGVNN